MAHLKFASRSCGHHARARADTATMALTPVWVNPDTCRVIADAVDYSAYSSSLIMAAALHGACSSSSSSSGTDALPTKTAVTHMCAVTLSDAPTWHGERCLFQRSLSKHSSPSVGVNGPFGTLKVRVDQANGRQVVVNTPLSHALKEGVETHVAVALSDDKVAVYMDGQLVASKPIQQPHSSSVKGTLVIAKSVNCDGVPCSMRDFLVVHRTMSATEVASAAAATLKVDTASASAATTAATAAAPAGGVGAGGGAGAGADATDAAAFPAQPTKTSSHARSTSVSSIVESPTMLSDSAAKGC